MAVPEIKAKPCADCGGETERIGARFCPSCCDRNGHEFHPHSHPLIPHPDPKKALRQSRPCSGRFWCDHCGSWLDGPACPPVQEAA